MIPSDLTSIIAIAEFLIVLAAIIGGYLSVRGVVSKSSEEVQSRVRDALKDENELLQSRITRVEAENRRLSDMLQLLTTIFEKRGVTIIIDDSMIQVKDKDGSTVVVRQSAPVP